MIFLHKKYLYRSLLLSLFTVLMVATYTYANTTDSDKIKVIFYPSTVAIDEDDSITNYVKGLLDAISERSAIDYEIEFLKEPRRDNSLAPNEVAIVGVSTANHKFVTNSNSNSLLRAIGFTRHSLSTNTNKGIFYGDINAIEGKTVATHWNNYGNFLLNTYLKENNISVNYVYGDPEHYTEVEADFYIVNTEVGAESEFYPVLNLGLESLYLVGNIGDSELVEKINAEISHYITTEGFYNEGKSPLINYRNLTPQEAEKLKGKTFSVGYNRSHQPFQYEDENGKPAGSVVRLMNFLAEEYDFTLNYTSYDLITDDHSNFDIIIPVIGDINYINKYYDATDAYAEEALGISIRNDIKKFDLYTQKARVGVHKYLHINNLTKGFANDDDEIVFYDYTDDFLNAFADGELDAIVYSDAGAGYVRSMFKNSSQAYTTHLSIVQHFYISKKISDEYLKLFNALTHMYDKEYQLYKLIETDIFAEQTSFYRFIKNNIEIIIIGILLIIVIFCLLFLHFFYSKRKAVERVMNTDKDTGLISLAKFHELVQQKLSSASPNEYEIVSFNTNLFYVIEYYYGAEVGKQVISTIANTLSTAYLNTGAIISRKHTGRFLILKKTNKKDHIGKMSEVIENTINPAIREIVGSSFPLNFSVGIYHITEPTQDLQEMINFADIANEEGRHLQKTTCTVYTAELSRKQDAIMSISYRMESALQNNEFGVEYQPRVDLKTKEIQSFEAFATWVPPIGGRIEPEVFLEVFTRNGFIAKLDLYIFEKVCQFIQENLSDKPDFTISVCFALHTLGEQDFEHNILTIVDKYGVNPNQIELEVTALTMKTDREDIMLTISNLREKGFLIALADFGASISPLRKLEKIKIDVMKIDKTFISNSECQEILTVIKVIIQLGKELGIKVVADGVATKKQAMWLGRAGCQLAQSDLFYKQLSPQEAKNLLGTFGKPKETQDN